MSKLTAEERERLVADAYEAILARVAEGAVARTDPRQLLLEQSSEWAARAVAIPLASALVEYAAVCVGQTVTDPRELARRRRVYGITRAVYADLRLSPRLAPAAA